MGKAEPWWTSSSTSMSCFDCLQVDHDDEVLFANVTEDEDSDDDLLDGHIPEDFGEYIIKILLRKGGR